MREMNELQPRVVLTLGWDAAEPIRQALGVSDWKWVKTRQLEHGTFDHTAGRAKLISLSHPSGGTWSKSLGELERALTRPDFLESSAHPAG